MIQRIEHGRVQVNENPSKRQRRRRPSTLQSQEGETGRELKPPILKATIDLMVYTQKPAAIRCGFLRVRSGRHVSSSII